MNKFKKKMTFVYKIESNISIESNEENTKYIHTKQIIEIMNKKDK